MVRSARSHMGCAPMLGCLVQRHHFPAGHTTVEDRMTDDHSLIDSEGHPGGTGFASRGKSNNVGTSTSSATPRVGGPGKPVMKGLLERPKTLVEFYANPKAKASDLLKFLVQR